MTSPHSISFLNAPLDAARSDLLAALAPFPLTKWDTHPVHTSGDRWTLLQVVRHLYDMHLFQRRQLEALLAGQPTVDETFELDRWNRLGQRRLQLFAPQDLLAGLAASHQQLCDWIAALSAQDLALSGWHFAMRQPLPLQQFIELIAFHEQLHTKEILNSYLD